MSLIRKKPRSTTANPLRYDPTKTGPVRRAWMKMLEAKFRELDRRVYQRLVHEYGHGLTENCRMSDPSDTFAAVEDVTPGRGLTLGMVVNTQYDFPQSEGYLQQFKSWLLAQLSELFYPMAEDSWWREYVAKGWQMGAAKVYAAWKAPSDFLASSFNQPVAINKVKLLAARVLTELENVTQDMATKMSRVLVDGLIQGKSPREVAREMSKSVEGISKQRALTIARTETVRAHAEGQLDTLRGLGMSQVGVAVEWSTSHMGLTRKGNPSPCPQCAPMEGVVFTLEEATGMIPRHPNCMCSFIPANVGEDGTNQVRSYKGIGAAMARSLKAEMPKSTKSKNAKAKQSRWTGTTAKISKSRPESIFTKGKK